MQRPCPAPFNLYMMSDQQATIFKCIIVDDEPVARQVIRQFVERVPFLAVAGEYGNAIEAMLLLKNAHIDILFVDIQMPQINGLEFVRSLYNPPKVIMTTAYKEYAHEGFELDVTDYLLKPIRFERFLRAVHKAVPLQNMAGHESATEERSVTGEEQSFIYIKCDRKMHRIILDELIYIESNKDYVKLYTEKGFFITRQTITSVEAMLSTALFTRIHRSYIVSNKRIKSFTNELVEIGDKELPVGKLYRHNLDKYKVP